jgi:hypothetical protein
VIQNLQLDEFAKGKIKITTDELVGEREECKELLGN